MEPSETPPTRLTAAPRRWLASQWEAFWAAVGEVESACTESRIAQQGRLDLGLVGLVILAAVCLSLLEYYGSSNDYRVLSGPLSLFVDSPEALLREIFGRGTRADLYRLSYWSACTFLGYFVVPALYARFVLGMRLRDVGLRVRGTMRHGWIYVAMFALVLPLLVIVAGDASFQRTYPFYDNAHLSPADFLAWQAIYALQFFSLEFFFRGFLVHGIKARFGVYAVLLSVLPYCMIHFGKPLPETIGAIVAGIALGGLSLFTGSIWLGVAIHVSIAVSMDVLSLAAQGRWFW